jgi:hypothetical protein
MLGNPMGHPGQSPMVSEPECRVVKEFIKRATNPRRSPYIDVRIVHNSGKNRSSRALFK